MHNKKQQEQVIRTNQEILDTLCRDMRIIAAYGNLLSPALKKRLYSAEYWAKYYMRINNGLIRQHWGVRSPDLLFFSGGIFWAYGTSDSRLYPILCHL